MYNESSDIFEIDLEMEGVSNCTTIDKELYRVFPEYGEGGQSDKVVRSGPNVVLNNYGSIGSININAVVKEENPGEPILDLDALEQLEQIENSHKCQDEMKELLLLQYKLKGLVNKTRKDLVLYLEETMKEVESYIEARKKGVIITLTQLDKELSLKQYQNYELEEIAKKLNLLSLQTLEILKDFICLK
jgi:hypothetical protein